MELRETAAICILTASTGRMTGHVCKGRQPILNLRLLESNMTGKKPLTFSNPFWSGNFPDPFLLKVRGRYYAYGTEGEMHPPAGASVFPVLMSNDLVQWNPAGKAMRALENPYFGYWAPE